MPDPTPIRIPVDPLAPAAGAVDEAVRVLRGGGLVAYPTDTLYGLGADPRQPEAVERLFRAKGRAAEKAVPLVAADLRAGRAAGRRADAPGPPARAAVLARPAHPRD